MVMNKWNRSDDPDYYRCPVCNELSDWEYPECPKCHTLLYDADSVLPEGTYEYRIQVYFTEDSPYGSRSYKGKIFDELSEASALYDKAVEYYSTYNGFDRVVIEKRTVSDWKRI